MTPIPCLIICNNPNGYVTLDGTTQPQGTAFARIVTALDGSDYAPGPGLALVQDDGRALYVQNSGKPPAPPSGVAAPVYVNDADAIAQGAPTNTWYIIKGSGLTTQLRIPS